MSATDIAVKRLQVNEGFRSEAYRDTKGKLTIGYGFCVDAGISQYAALELLTAQTVERAEALSRYAWAQGLDDVRLSVLIELAFNDGLSGLLHFPKMIDAIRRKDWKTAHDELIDSEAARSLPQRYMELAHLLLVGDA